MESFSDWLLKELKNRNISQSDLARIAGLGSGTISNIMSGNRKVGQDTLNKIANGLRLPPELVYEKAGLLPPKSELSEIKRTLIHLAKDLLIAMLSWRLKFSKLVPTTIVRIQKQSLIGKCKQT